jgi:uncharacterized protein with PQ loop repeat
MDATEVVGFCAICLSAVKGIPQLYQIETSGNVKSFSKQAILISIFASLLWLYYGIKKKTPSIILSAFGSILAELYLLFKILKSENDK